MKNLRLAVLALLVGVSTVVSLSASATAMSLGAMSLEARSLGLPASTQHVDSAVHPHPAQDRVLLAQYGGGGDDDDDAPVQRQPRQQGGGGGGGGGGGAGMLNAIIPLIVEGAKEAGRQRQQQQYNDMVRRQNQAIKNQQAIERKKKQADEARYRKLRAEEKRLEDIRRRNAIQPQPAPYQPPTAYPNPPPYVPPQPVVPVVDPNPLPSDDTCPDNFQQLKVGQTVLNPYRTDFPADPRICSGTTRNGCYLRIMNGPAACGSKPTCVMHCPSNVPVLVPVPDRRPPVQPACAYPPCAPQPPSGNPVPVPPTPSTPAEWTLVVTPKVEPQPPATPAEWTLVVTPKIEPQPPATPAEWTLVVTSKVEPPPPPTKPEKTVHADPKVEPQPPPTKPEKTVHADPKIEPDRPTTPPEKTVHADPKVEPDRPTTPPEKTVHADPKVEPDRPTTTPEKTVHADPKIEPDRPTTPPEKTVISESKIEPDRMTTLPERTIIPASLIEPDHPNTPQRTVVPATKIEPSLPPKEPDFGFDDAAPIQPPVDGKGCTPTGGIPQPRFSIDPNYGRKIYIGALGAIPEAGAVLKPLVEALWKDDSQATLLKEMKDYVDRLVPELLTQDRLTEMENRLKDIKDLLDNYHSMTGSEKGSDLLVALSHITANSSDFLADNGANKAAPDRTLGYFVEFGLLKLAVLKERLQKDKEFWPETDPQKYAHDHAEREKQLNDAIRLLAKRSGELRQALMDRRLSKLRIDHYVTHWQGGHGGGGATNNYRAVDDFCDWRGRGGPNNDDRARQSLDQRRKDVERDYGAAVDAMLKPILDWTSVLPETIAAEQAKQFKAQQEQTRELERRIQECSYCESRGIVTFD